MSLRAAVVALALVPSVVSLPGLAENPASAAPQCPVHIGNGAGCLIATDFGDAPASYLTGDQAGGPRHALSSSLKRASLLAIGAHLDGFVSVGVDSDDMDLPTSAEDGVAAGTTIDRAAPKVSMIVVNATGAPAVPAAWPARGFDKGAGEWLASTGGPVSAYLRLGLGLVGFGGSVLGLAWLLGRRRREETTELTADKWSSGV